MSLKLLWKILEASKNLHLYRAKIYIMQQLMFL